MKLEKKQIAILVSGMVALLVLVGGAWVLVSSRPNAVVKQDQATTESVAGPSGESGAGNLADTSTVQDPVVTALDAPVADVKTKDEATKAVGDLDMLVDSAGNDVE